MYYLKNDEEKEAEFYFSQAISLARKNSKCLRSKCGAVIVSDDEIIGKGVNSPPQDICIEKCFKDELPQGFKSDRTCCVHAEQRAIFDALANNPKKIKGSRIYFIRTDLEGNVMKAGEPYCTICSKSALDVGIAEFALWHEEGICIYNTKEYNEISFKDGLVKR